MTDTNDHRPFSLIDNTSESISTAEKSETDHSDTSSAEESHSPETNAVEAYLWEQNRPWEPFDARHYYHTAPSGDGAHGSSHINASEENETDSETA